MSDRPRALVTLPDVAEPSDTGRRVRSRVTLAGLAERFDLDVVVTGAYKPGADRPVQQLDAIQRWLALPVTRPSKAVALREATRYRAPIELHNEVWAPARHALEAWPLAERYDFAWFGAMSHFVGLEDLVHRKHTAIDFDDLPTAKWSRHLASTRWSLRTAPTRVRRLIELRAWRRAEIAMASRVDAVVTADPDDLERCRALGIPRAAVVPNSYSDPGRLPKTLDDPPFVAFVANFTYQPNLDAARELILDVFPLLRRTLPGCRLRLIGNGSTEIGSALLDRDEVTATGRVPEIAPLLEGCVATLMPIRTGGGTRVKAMEAFALGVPVVGTRFALAGLGAADGVHCVIADTPKQFAEATAALAGDTSHRARMTDEARRLYEEKFVPAASKRAIDALIQRITSRSTNSRDEGAGRQHAAL